MNVVPLKNSNNGVPGQRAPAVIGGAETEEIMPPARSEDIAAILEGQNTLTLELRASNLMTQQQTAALNKLIEKMETTKDKTALPNWLMPLICTAFISLVVWIFNSAVQNLQREAEKLESRVQTQETYMKATREQLIAHGWQVDNQGNITAPTTVRK